MSMVPRLSERSSSARKMVTSACNWCSSDGATSSAARAALAPTALSRSASAVVAERMKAFQAKFSSSVMPSPTASSSAPRSTQPVAVCLTCEYRIIPALSSQLRKQHCGNGVG
jgi:hypothetical protein